MRIHPPAPRAPQSRAVLSIALLASATLLVACGEGGITAPGQPVQQFTAISVSAYHWCVVAVDGDAYCWGGNFYGEIGVGRTGPDVVAPSVVSSNTRWVSVAAGHNSTCGLTESGLISCWGYNGSGEFGNGSNSGDSVPAPPARGPTFQVSSTGSSHTCALSTDGDAYCWGYGRDRQLGQGSDESNRDLPARVRGGHRFASISAGSAHTCALKPDGTAWCWGRNRHGQLGIGAKGDPRGTPQQVLGDLRFIQLSAGENQTCAVTPDRLAYCWGANPDGVLGDGTTEERDVPTLVNGGLRFRRVATATAHTCGLTAEGTLYCWGRNDAGALGNGTREPSAEPSRVSTTVRFEIFSLGAFDTCAISTAGDPYCWGAGAVPRSQGPTETPQRVIIFHDQIASEPEPDTTIVPAAIAFESVVAGPGWACGIDDVGKGYCWTSDGRDPFSGEGNGADGLPQPLPGDLRWKQLAAGGSFACGIATEGAAYCWGRNFVGQLGNGTTEDSPVPVRVAGTGRYTFIAAAHTGTHACAVAESGETYCWGYDGFAGALGSGSAIPSGFSSVPVRVVGGLEFESVAAGERLTCALNRAGDVHCWGANWGEIRGPDTAFVRYSPVPVAPGTRFRLLSTGYRHICGESVDGLANYCWGENEAAQVGTGERSYEVPFPTPTHSVASLVTVAAAVTHSCGATSHGHAYCWGYDYDGALGTGERFEIAPTPVLGGLRFKSLTAANDITCGLTFEGELYCWGAGYGRAPRLVARP